MGKCPPPAVGSRHFWGFNLLQGKPPPPTERNTRSSEPSSKPSAEPSSEPSAEPSSEPSAEPSAGNPPAAGAARVLSHTFSITARSSSFWLKPPLAAAFAARSSSSSSSV
ncbi:MAG: hypothetical protein EOM03_13945 [Clostridia bacterium]|nr:hypothetical protein [Clostridia bacterium]